MKENSFSYLIRSGRRGLLTPRRLAVLLEIEGFLRQYGYPPTVRELGQRLNLRSPSTVQSHLEVLELAGMLVPHTHYRRGHELSEQALDLLSSRGDLAA